MDTFKCKWCGKTFEKMTAFGIGGSYCSNACKHAAEEAKNSKGPKSSTSESFSSGANAQPVIVEKGPSADEIRAEAEVERMERDENASQPWKFDKNFYNSESISKISFPNSIEDIEKTVLRIISSAVDKIKKILNETASEYTQRNMGDNKANAKPYFTEIHFTECCIEKATEGIKKIKRYEESNINTIVADCNESLDDLKTKWLPKLIEKRDKKKKANKILAIVLVSILVVVILLIVIFSGHHH